ncbi:MAG: magnesium transporter CorA family protein [Oscillospiraceae bacterium]
MIAIYKTFDGVLREISEVQDGCWVSVTRPTDAELQSLSAENGLELEDLRAALDDEERARIQTEDNYTMVLVDIPVIEKRNEKEWYVTIPLSIILTDKIIFTICLDDNPIISSFLTSRIRNFHTHMKTRFVLQLLYRNSTLFLQYLRSINKKSEQVEKKLHGSTKNQELIELLELEKSLVYFTTSLSSNEVVLEKLQRTENVRKYEEDSELLEDVIIENKQAIQMANIYSGILSGMMDAFASVISNNLNIVMKFLATVTIVLSVPNMIFGAYGMNVNNAGIPFAGSIFGFGIVMLISFVLTLAVALVFSKQNLF